MIVDENGMCTLDNEDMSYHSNTPRKKTNADRIRTMSDEELAKWLNDNDSYFPIGDSTQYWLDWLKQEVQDATD